MFWLHSILLFRVQIVQMVKRAVNSHTNSLLAEPLEQIFILCRRACLLRRLHTLVRWFAGWLYENSWRKTHYARRDLFAPAATFSSHKLCKVVSKKCLCVGYFLFIFNGVRMKRKHSWKLLIFGPILFYLWLSFYHLNDGSTMVRTGEWNFYLMSGGPIDFSHLCVLNIFCIKHSNDFCKLWEFSDSNICLWFSCSTFTKIISLLFSLSHFLNLNWKHLFLYNSQLWLSFVTALWSKYFSSKFTLNSEEIFSYFPIKTTFKQTNFI